MSGGPVRSGVGRGRVASRAKETERARAQKAQVTTRVNAKYEGLDLIDEGEPPDADALEDAEPPELEHAGDSDLFGDDPEIDQAHDLVWRGRLPLIRQLPRFARPVVRYRIDEHYQVHFLPKRRKRRSERGQHIIVLAVARYLRRLHEAGELALEQCGDWRSISRLPRNQLANELPDDLPMDEEGDATSSARKWLASQAGKSQIPAIWHVGILLASGDVITPLTVTEGAARQGESVRVSTTLAAALRQKADADKAEVSEPTTLADGRSWTKDDWRSFRNKHWERTAPKEPPRADRVTVEAPEVSQIDTDGDAT